MHDPVYRAPMRSRRDDVDPAVAVERALTEGLVGVGGQLDHPPDSFDAAVASVAATAGERVAERLRRFAAVPDGAFAWTRHPDGTVHLGRIVGRWRFDASSAASDLDLQHVRPCHWLPDPVPPSELPAAVERALARGGRNFQGTHGSGVERETADLWVRSHR